MPLSTDFLRQQASEWPIQGTVLWSGAGVSRAYPSCLPLGAELVERVFGQLIDDEALTALQVAYGRLGIHRSMPRLEMLLDVVTNEETYGLRGLDCLTDLLDAHPNENHKFFSWHLENGGSHITANFDACIEIASDSAWDRDRIVHFHGSVADGVDSLGATLRAIERGFTPRIKTRLEGAMDSADVLVVVGYSGSDFFDVDPFLRDFLGSRSWIGRTVVWVDHEHGPGLKIHDFDQADQTWPLQTQWFHDAGATVLLARGSTSEALGAIAEGLGYGPLSEVTGPCGIGWSPSFATSAAERQRATLRLYQQTCYRAKVRDLIEREPHLRRIADADGTSADLAWAEGRYADARRLWRVQFAGNGGRNRLKRLERTAATLWVQGRLIPAYLVLSRALRQAPADTAEATLLAETTLNVLRDMSRTPELRWFASERRHDRIAAMLPQTLAGVGFHMQARLGPKLSRESAGPANTVSQSIFLEADALHPILNYRQASLRDRIGGGERFTAQAYQAHTGAFEYIGARGDAVRSMFIPGAPCAFGLRELLAGVSRMQVGSWQRVRWIGRAIMDKARCAGQHR